ncbi:SWIB-domain-containing protein [Phlegmacium glaucopus]|nr:SWIB-domain-containing protein [Phlegmacium glaucopus]
MPFDFGSLEPHIHQILSAPGTDLSTISAKRVRRQLVELDLSLTTDFMKENREEVDAVIASVFEKVSGAQGTGDNPGAAYAAEEKSQRTEQESDFPDEDAAEEGPPPPKKIKKAGKNGRGLSDAELARKLSSEINSRSTRTGGKGRGASAAGKKGSRTKKSAAIVDSDDDSDGIGKRKKSGGTAKGGFAKEFALSQPLAAVLQIDQLSRPQVVKQLWVYIKGNELQNPENRREILCDAGLRAVFGVDKIDMFKMNKVLGQHLHEANS